MSLPGADDSYSPDAAPVNGINPSVNPMAEALRNNGVDPGNFSVEKPTAMGRVAELATAGAYDPTSGVDTGKFGGPKTKFGALVSILRPALEGAAIGGFTGRWHPGGGFGGANEFYQQQRMRQMMAMQFAMNQYKMQSELAKNAAETGFYNRRPGLTRTANTIKGRDAAGNEIYMAQNPNTGRYEPVQGVTPESSAKPMMTDKGLVSVSGNTAVPITLGDAASDIASRTGESAGAPSKAAQADESGLIPPYEIGAPTPGVKTEGSPSQSPMGIVASGSSSGVPLHPSGYGKPKPTAVTSRDANGNETTNLIDENPNSPTFGKMLKGGVGSRAPLPDRTAGRNNAKADDTARAEQYAAAALAKSGGDPDKAVQFMNGLQLDDPNATKDLNRLLPQIRKSITDRARSRKPARKSALDMLTIPPTSQVPTEIPQQP